MSEMLGNQYFLARNYSLAAIELEKALLQNPKNKGIRRKLIICFAQTGQISKALQVFLSLVKEDAEFIINTDPVDDDCPCPELLYESEAINPPELVSLDHCLRLAMLWLYCDVETSVAYFNKALSLTDNQSPIKSVLAILELHRRKKKLKGS